MVGNSPISGIAENDVTAMKETLRAQQQLLQKLYAELDQEREASATAASEALDMILRLQGEKAAVKMEASHYKRMAEEKIDHAEATLSVFEELMYEKEMEIASLEYQVLAYKHKLFTLGIDINATEFEFPDDLLSRSDQQNGENGESSTVRRLSSMPPLQFKTLRAARKRERSPRSPSPSAALPVSDTVPKTSESSDIEESVQGTLDSYWNQIKVLDEKVKVISDCKESGGEKLPNLRIRRGRSCSVFSQASTKTNNDQADRVTSTNASSLNASREGTQDRDAISNPSSGTNVHDVFEVPETNEKREVNENGNKRLENWISDPDNRLTKPDSVSEETAGSFVKTDMDKIKGRFSAHHDRKIPSPREMKAIVWQKKGGGVDLESQAEILKLNRRIEQLERERISTRQEIVNEGEREEQLRLLKDIHSQLKLLQSDMKSLKPKKASPKVEDVPLEPLQKEMLYFWL